MAPFSAAVVVESLKEKVDALLAQGNRLFVASAAGTLRVYRIEDSSGGGSATTTTSAVLVETKKAFTRRAIDQLGFIRDINALVVLSDSTISLYDATSLALLTTLFQTRGAQTFAIHTSIPAPSALLDDDDAPSPSMRTHLVVGIKKRLLLFSWADGALMPSPDPLVLPHTPRSIAFVSSDRVVVAYSSNEQVLAGLGPLRLIGSDLLQGREPPEKPQSVVSGGLGGLTAGLGGMGGYMGLGSLSKGKANVIRVGEDEVLVARDNVGISFNSKGDLKRSEDLEWAAAPDEMVCAQPFMLSVLPSIAATSNAPSSSATPTPTIQIRSAHTLHLLQTFALPSSVSPHTIHHLIPSSSSTSSQSTLRPPLYFVSTPTERAALASEGSKIWCLSAQSLGETLDELVKRGEYEEGLAFMESVDERTLPDKESRETLLRTLRSLQLFQSPSRSAKDEAIDSFITLSLNPTKVIALFPPIVSGRLSTPEAEWTELFGGPKVTERKELATSATAATEEEEGGTGRKVLEVLGIVGKESHEAGEAESIKSDEETEKERAANLKQSFESLLHYLSDRRQKVLGALGPVDLSPLEALPPLSTVPKDELLTIPSKPMQDLPLEQVYRLAQVVDTALFKSYLVVRPSLVGSLCRLENFCEVAEVEEQLLEKKKYGDLIDLYRTRKEHAKALKLLKELSKDEDDLEDKLEPIVRYLLGMGPKYLDLIFETSPWVFSQSFDAGMQIFTADPDTVEPFPRSRVLAHLETISQRATTAYLEFLIDKLGEEGADFHDRLAELYLGTSATTSKKGSRATAKAPSPESYAQALNFLKTSQHYRPDHLLRVLPDDDMYEARAVLLGRLGNHEAALQIYVHRLEDYDKAEEYCLRVSQSNPPVNIFLPLLRIYLVPKPPHTKLLIPPALSLIAKHSTSLEPLEVIDLLPPLLTMQEVHSFFLKTLREGKARRNEARVLREVMKSQGQAADRTLMRLQERRVRITDTRLCPWCKKRLGDSVIAVHAPRGEITHLHCKDAFSASLKR